MKFFEIIITLSIILTMILLLLIDIRNINDILILR